MSIKAMMKVDDLSRLMIVVIIFIFLLPTQSFEEDRKLTAEEWFKKANTLYDGRKYTDPKKAIEYLNNAIKLKPNYAFAYNNRGNAYNDLGQYQRAIEDCNKAIQLKLNNGDAYNNRGTAYCGIGQYQSAIADFNEAIRLKPNYAAVFIGRGNVYFDIGKYQLAIEDFNKAIQLEPNNADAYYNRGNADSKLGQYQRAIEDYNRGVTYGKDLNQHQLSIDDFNQAIRLKPNYTDAYNNRGLVYYLQGKKNLACHDAQKACELGDCQFLEMVKSKGICR
jgi:tetratricopeptide (TPR) repeat protein